MVELEKCQVCGRTPILSANLNGAGFRFMCLYCRSTTGDYNTVEKAKKAWNHKMRPKQTFFKRNQKRIALVLAGACLFGIGMLAGYTAAEVIFTGV